jgi:hypothetical protein
MQVEMAKVETQKETIIVNPDKIIQTTDNHNKRKVGVQLRAVIGAGVGAATGAIISKKKHREL